MIVVYCCWILSYFKERFKVKKRLTKIRDKKNKTDTITNKIFLIAPMNKKRKRSL